MGVGLEDELPGVGAGKELLKGRHKGFHATLGHVLTRTQKEGR